MIIADHSRADLRPRSMRTQSGLQALLFVAEQCARARTGRRRGVADRSRRRTAAAAATPSVASSGASARSRSPKSTSASDQPQKPKPATTSGSMEAEQRLAEVGSLALLHAAAVRVRDPRR